MQASQQLFYRGTLVVLERQSRQFRVRGNVANCPKSDRPRVTTVANDRYIVLQQLRYRCLTAAATGRQWCSSTDSEIS